MNYLLNFRDNKKFIALNHYSDTYNTKYLIIIT